MAGSGGVTLLVLLLACWRGAMPQLSRVLPDATTELLGDFKGLDDSSGEVFDKDLPSTSDEILLQEILNPSKPSLLDKQRALSPATKSTSLSSSTTQSKGGSKTSYPASMIKKLEEETSESEGEPFEAAMASSEEEKETLYQMKSLTSLGKIIDSLRKALGNSLKQRRLQHKNLWKSSKHENRQ